jgi:hypothetical protein
MINKKIAATDIGGKSVIGEVILVYTDALASGASDYVQITFLSVVDSDNKVHQVRPRDVRGVL